MKSKNQARKIILLEINELPFRVLDHYVDSNPKSTLATLLPATRQIETYASDLCDLSPWITWPTLHRGVRHEQHGIMHLGQDLERVDRDFPPIWKMLVDGGIDTGVFGPMHSFPLPKDHKRYAFYLPDVFANTPETHPKSLEAFQSFNLSMSRQSARNVSTSLDWGSAIKFLAGAPFLGLRASTVFSLLGQLRDERSEPWKSTRRRTYQPVLTFDFFMKQLELHKPSFSNCFTNHVASAMHRYWAAIFPEDFDDLQLEDEWRNRYAGEVMFAMDWVDDFFKRCVKFSERNPEYLVVMTSSMGQHAKLGAKISTQLYLRQCEALMSAAGIGKDEWSKRPAMDPTVSIVVDEDKAPHFEEFLKELVISGKPARYSARERGFFDLHFGQSDFDPSINHIQLRGEEVSLKSLGLEIVEVEDEAGSTAYHCPEGILLIFDHQDRSPKSPHRERVDSTDIAPNLLEHFNLDIPAYMNRPGAFHFDS